MVGTATTMAEFSIDYPKTKCYGDRDVFLSILIQACSVQCDEMTSHYFLRATVIYCVSLTISVRPDNKIWVPLAV